MGGSEEVLFLVKSWTPEPRGAGFGAASHDLRDDVALVLLLAPVIISGISRTLSLYFETFDNCTLLKKTVQSIFIFDYHSNRLLNSANFYNV